MKWTSLVTPVRLPTHPGGVLIGPLFQNDDATPLFCFSWNGKRVMSTQWGYSLKVGSALSVPDGLGYRGYMGFTGTYNFWVDPTYGWVASTLPIGTALLEYWEWTDPTNTSLGGSYRGDAFYTGTFPALDGSQSWAARGSLRGTTSGSYGGTPITVTTGWDYWQLDSGTYGEYIAKGNATGSKYLGSPQWANGSTLYTRSVSQTSGHYSYGAIAWNSTASKYILGTYGSVSGWNESASAPTSGSSWTLAFAKPEGSTVTGSSVTLAYNGRVAGSETIDMFAVNAGTWGAAA